MEKKKEEKAKADFEVNTTFYICPHYFIMLHRSRYTKYLRVKNRHLFWLRNMKKHSYLGAFAFTSPMKMMGVEAG